MFSIRRSSQTETDLQASSHSPQRVAAARGASLGQQLLQGDLARRNEAALLSAASVPRRGTGRRARARWSRRRGSSAAIRSGPARAGAERRPASALCRRPCLGHCEASRNAAAVRAAGCARRAGVKPRAERRQSPHGRPGLASVLAGSGRAAVSCP